ncbi:MAG: TonB family protein [Steroidobacteraceae bacterium]
MARPIFLALLATFFVRPARADLIGASGAYQKGDYATAYHDFRELAELGQPTAQYDLAVMYYRGEGTRQSEIYAYAWASLAAQNGLEKAKTLAQKLRPLLAPGSEKVAADIAGQFGNAVLDARLNPKIVEGEAASLGDPHRCYPLGSYPDDLYPPEAVRKGIEGQVYIEFTLMPDGRSRMPRIIYAVPQGMFDSATRKALLHSEFAPAAAGQPPRPCTVFFNFQLRGATARDYPRLNVFVKETLTRAERGDPGAQMLYGMLLVGLPQLKKPRSEALPWFLKSAQAGTPLAQFQVGYSLLKGWGCDCDVNKGLDWLRRAAQAGQPAAEVTLAMYALRGNPDEERLRQAKLWLEQAAASGDRDGKLYLAALLAASAGEQARDSKRALNLVNEVFRGVDDDPTAYEIRAAAQADGGDFKAAFSSENKALWLAEKLKWDLTPMDDRMAHYKAKQPWYGTLLEF